MDRQEVQAQEEHEIGEEVKEDEEKGEIEVEQHSTALKKRQELFEIRRQMILTTFISLLKEIE